MLIVITDILRRFSVNDPKFITRAPIQNAFTSVKSAKYQITHASFLKAKVIARVVFSCVHQSVEVTSKRN